MSDADDDAVPTEGLPESLLEAVDSLTENELEALLSYVEQRIEADWSSLRADIEASAAGEVLDVERDGPYALVRAHPPEESLNVDTDTTGVDTDVVSLYHVRREHLSDDSKSLHWAYLGDVYDPGQHRCEACGRTLEETTEGCPYCGDDEIRDPETET